ncbi:uncharacterized protein EI90DRAFT_2967924 [Cantharellus anzutake]|uniref:uncharacterized protein n=1 Tax=Cantharellus anzutake TaxID=1750568 RepID=UPI00190715E2|nr:uncharacterized protein EI90DRAFT_2967924 [Cantharellus anzutake]KAF8338072.1 hypothetical protein EI90DRAFT_2967924 [Cantharellus anzutake]
MSNLNRSRVGPSTKLVNSTAAARVKPVGGSADAFLQAIAERRSVYALTRKSSIPDERVVEIVQHAVLHTPTSFNSQSNRAVVLFGENHVRLWDVVAESLRKILPPEQFEGMVGKVRSFQAGYLTILYFIDTKVVKGLEEQFKPYAENFAPWAQQSIGMLQSNVWVALEEEGLGASLQHYSNLIEAEVKKVYNIPEEWSLVAQQPVGVPAKGWKAPEKDAKPLEETVKVFH